MNFSPEMTFCPVSYPYEITDPKKGKALVKKANLMLGKVARLTGIAMYAKLDPHHEKEGGGHTYIIEIAPFTHFETHWITEGTKEEQLFKLGIAGILAGMRKLGFAPSVKRKRGGIETQFIGGGCHLHYGADLFPIGPNYYQSMERFHRNLTMSYANHPEIRWLFADWMSCNAHRTLYDPTKKLDRAKTESVEDTLFRRMLVGSIHAVEPRFMVTSKNSYLTFEFRFFRMVESAEELCLIVRFVDAWMNHLVTETLTKLPVKLQMTKRRWAELKTVAGSKKHLKNFLDEIGLDWQDYEMFYNRNYRTRMKFGSMV